MKIKLQDNLAYPKEKEAIKFEGKEPFKLYGEIDTVFKDILEVSGKDIFERIIKWDATDVNKSFYCKKEVERGIDTWSKIKLTVTFQGNQNSNTREGKITISIKPFFITEVETSFLKGFFWWLYYFIYYKKKRLQDFYMAKNMINKLKMRIAELYGIKVEESL